MSLPANDLPTLASVPERATLRVAALALFFALPELALILCEIWVVAYISQWALSGMFNLTGPLFWVLDTLLYGTAAWLTFHTGRLAIVNRNLI